MNWNLYDHVQSVTICNGLIILAGKVAVISTMTKYHFFASHGLRICLLSNNLKVLILKYKDIGDVVIADGADKDFAPIPYREYGWRTCTFLLKDFM